MKQYPADRIRNVGLFSHGGAGKTSLTEALLFDAKAINRLGRVEDGTTVADFDPDEIKRHISVSTAVARRPSTTIEVAPVPQRSSPPRLTNRSAIASTSSASGPAIANTGNASATAIPHVWAISAAIH